MTPSKEIALWLCSGCCALVFLCTRSPDRGGWLTDHFRANKDFWRCWLFHILRFDLSTSGNTSSKPTVWWRMNKKKSRKMNIFKALSWKINQICSWLREVWKPLIVSDPDPFGQSLLSWVENMSENICFWCPHEKCDGILWREKAGRLSSDRLLSVEAAAAFYSQMTSLISNSPRFHFKDDTELGLKTLLIGPQWPHTHAWYGFSILYILCLA